ncbi:MAG: hypothetical protein CVV24_15015 [Ignavibacteriae bacterium HGW-Ignavibacteriae-3]|nr:MAG: hypothetical protein CVV24_15015 [Ignavibacteriae bacterium HGW-Ignavibacteriae-3]
MYISNFFFTSVEFYSANNRLIVFGLIIFPAEHIYLVSNYQLFLFVRKNAVFAFSLTSPGLCVINFVYSIRYRPVSGISLIF